MKVFSFEKLEVWKEVKDLTKEIYITTASFPESEKFGLVNQIRRAIVSVSSNIAEGSARSSKKEQSYFYQIAFSSLMEVLSQLIISCELGYLENNKLNDLREILSKSAYKLNRLRSSLDV
jgi:four helix bundle protein